MIVTSKRCFLNILTQICDKETLLQANYYMADVRSADGTAYLHDDLKYDENGALVINHKLDNPIAALGIYNINYGKGEIDPSPFITDITLGLGSIPGNPVERFNRYLNSPETLIATYNWLFRNELRGNGIQIVIFSDDSVVEEGYTHIACEYLAENFGCDIMFIDPYYRPKVKGKVSYSGNKTFAEKNIIELRDTQLLMDFNAVLSQTGACENLSNLTIYLNQFNVLQLIHLYNLLFPNNPLPPNNYTGEHVKQMIIGLVSQNLPKNQFNNVYVNDDIMSLLDQFENESGSSEY